MTVGLKSSASRNGLPTTKTQSPTRHGVAVAELGGGKVVFAEQLDEGDVAARIEADEHGVDEPAVGQAALHGGAGGAGDVKVRQRVAVGRNDDAGAAALAVGVEDGERGPRDAGDRFDAGRFGGEDGRVGLGGGARDDAKTAHENMRLQ